MNYKDRMVRNGKQFTKRRNFNGRTQIYDSYNNLWVYLDALSPTSWPVVDELEETLSVETIRDSGETNDVYTSGTSSSTSSIFEDVGGSSD